MKKIISCLILCAMLLAIIPVSVSAAVTADETWYNTTDKEFVISDAADLAAFNESLASDTFADKTVKLAANINMTDVAWSGTATFAGTFDGQGYTLSNLTISATQDNVGFFGATTGTATIENLTLSNISINVDNGSKVGAVVGNNSGSLTIYKLQVTGNISVDRDSTGGQNAGGILGCNGGGASCNISYTSFSGNVAARLDVGGILGRTNGNATVEIIACEVLNSMLKSGKADNGGLGGIIGIVYQNTASTSLNLAINGCVVSNITLKYYDTYSGSKNLNAGLLIGRLMTGGAAKGAIYATVSNVLLEGKFENTTTSAGVFGYVNSQGGVLTAGNGCDIDMQNNIVNIDSATVTMPTAAVMYIGSSTTDSANITFNSIYHNLSTDAISYASGKSATVSGLEKVATFNSGTDFSNMTTFIDVGEDLPRPVALYVNLVGYQTKANGDGTSNARLIFGIDDIAISALSSVGAYISVEGSSATLVSCDKVYKTITGGGITYSAEALGADYLYAIVIQNIDSNVTDFDAVINPCFTKGGVEYKNGNTSSANFAIKNS